LILITGAAGKTGKQLLQRLNASAVSVRVFVRNHQYGDPLLKLGAQEVVIGDFLDESALQSAFSGVQSVYHICPNMSPLELEIGRKVIWASQQNGLQHFVYHSVLHPQVASMPHHWAKMQVEDLLFQSGLPFTILQPAAYMQNIGGYWQAMLANGTYSIPYAITARTSMVNLNEVAEVAAKVLLEKGHTYATYELSGGQALSAQDVADIISRVSKKNIRAEKLDISVWEENARKGGMADYAVDTLLKMFAYYEKFDFIGNCNQLTWLLGRAPTRFEDFAQQMFA